MGAKFSAVLMGILLFTPAVSGQQTGKSSGPTAGDLMIDKYLADQTDRLSAKFLDGAKTLEEWQQKRPRLHQEYMDMLGLWPVPEKTPLHVTFTGPDGTNRPLVFGPEPHGKSSSYHRPGSEWGTGFRFTSAGCWHIRLARADTSGDVWLDVAA